MPLPTARRRITWKMSSLRSASLKTSHPRSPAWGWGEGEAEGRSITMMLRASAARARRFSREGLVE